MRIVKVADAKNNLSRHLAYVKRGGRVRILQRETPVADLVPVESVDGATDDDGVLARLEHLGLVRVGKRGPWPRELLRPGPDARNARVSAALIDERRSAR
jgi:antitoxin (DNA-binding transcriptional repressor) of toxin-antitoxin stability system